jgi:hypothetical protein
MGTLRRLFFIIFLGCCSSAFGQNLILIEGPNDAYWIQMTTVQTALIQGKTNQGLDRNSKTPPPDSLIQRLSSTFNQLVPQSFVGPGVPFIDSGLKTTGLTGNYLKWTYAVITNNNIKTLADVIVTFETNPSNGQRVRILKIDVRSPKVVKLNTDKIMKEYNDKQKAAAKLPPPPPRPGN